MARKHSPIRATTKTFVSHQCYGRAVIMGLQDLLLVLGLLFRLSSEDT